LDKILQIWERLPHLKVIVQYTGKLSQRYNNVYEVGGVGAGPEVGRTIRKAVNVRKIRISPM